MTANRLSDGAVVYLDTSDGWTQSVADARIAATAAEADALSETAERAVADRLVVAPYLIEMVAGDNDGGRPRPLRIKEVIRALGPSVRRDLGKHASGDDGDVPLR